MGEAKAMKHRCACTRAGTDGNLEALDAILSPEVVLRHQIGVLSEPVASSVRPS